MWGRWILSVPTTSIKFRSPIMSVSGPRIIVAPFLPFLGPEIAVFGLFLGPEIAPFGQFLAPE